MLFILTFSILFCSGCAKAELKKQQAYQAGLNQEANRIDRAEVESLDEESLDSNLGLKVDQKKKEQKEVQKNVSSGGSNAPSATTIVYVIDTLNNRVHKHNSGCSLLGDESGRATIENWTGTLDEAVSNGYTKCPECILKIGM